ncbi:rRNA pseudouridine synthase [bacterium]|nr:rRNA pseudouridine synthase [bacterium]
MTLNKSNEYRLNSFIAKATGISRRKADEAIKNGEVSIDGEVILNPGTKVVNNPVVKYQAQEIQLPEKNIWVIMNKPAGYITSRNDPPGRPIVMDLLPKSLAHLFPVGRLDSFTTGILFFTNDGKTAQRILHPKYCVPREYRVEIEGRLSFIEIELANKGVILDGRRAVPRRIERMKTGSSSEIWLVEFAEGRYHEVRRFFAALGHKIKSLERLSFAGINTRGLKKGEWCYMTEKEILQFKNKLENYARL